MIICFLVTEQHKELMRDIVTEKYTGGDVKDFILRKRTQNSKLKPYNLALLENFLVHLILARLPKEFDDFIVNFNVNPENWSFDTLIEKCVQEEERIKLKNGGTINYVGSSKIRTSNRPTRTI